jgi:pimeloyl-ACP methyl ester carboxylesterase
VWVIGARPAVSAPLVGGVLLADRRAAAAAIADFHVFNHAGHYVYREQPEACDGTVREFVARCLEP